MKQNVWRWLALGLCTVVFCVPDARAGEILDNQALERMLEAGFSLKVLEAKFRDSDCQFDDGSDKLIVLKAAAKKGGMEGADSDQLVLMVMDAAKKNQKELAALAGQLMNGAINYDKQEYESLMRNIQRKGKAMVPYILHHIEEENELKRQAVLDALKRLRDKTESVVRSVRLMLQDRHPAVRRQAAETLAELADAKLADELITDLDAHRGEHIDGIAFTLGYMEYKPAARTLTTVLTRSTDKDGRLASAFALGRLRAREPEALKALLDAVLDDQDERLRDVAGQSLAWMQYPKAVMYIKKAYERYRPGRAGMVRHLAFFKSVEAMEFLLEIADAEAPDVRAAALETLKHLTGEGYETAEDYRSWWQYNKARPDWIQVDASKGETVTEQPGKTQQR
ncbi:MAG: HEAT repeat domain-containing protein [Planctomycetes bacterium]|nr:HEAT repeat domain-containing protein [Planctomycetota bacterium]